jgi:hypothetical protein
VELNGADIITQNFKSQTDETGQETYDTVIDARPGDKIAVTANCSIFGKLKQTIAVPPADTAPSGGG